MSKKRRWSRYRPPTEVRTEDGRPQRARVIPPPPSDDLSAKGRPTKQRAGRSGSSGSSRDAREKAARKPGGKPAKRRTGAWIAGGIVVGAIGLPLGIAAIADRDKDEAAGITDDLVNTEFIGESLAHAIEEEGERATLVRFDEYGLQVEYFDPNDNRLRTVQTDSYTDGYTVRVEENHYDDFRPRPFDLRLVEPSAVVKAVEEALTEVDDPYTFSLRIEADRDSGEVTLVTYVSGDDTADVVAGLDGELIEVDRR